MDIEGGGGPWPKINHQVYQACKGGGKWKKHKEREESQENNFNGKGLKEKKKKLWGAILKTTWARGGEKSKGHPEVGE